MQSTEDDLVHATAGSAGPVLHTPAAGQSCVVLFLAGLGTTKEKQAYGRRRRVFEEAGYAVILADHYNEGERRCEPISNRAGWSHCQKDLFFRAIHETARTVPALVEFALSTFGAGVNIVAYGASMGGDIFLASMLCERRIYAACLERATPDWLRPGSTANVLGICAAGDMLYREHCPCNRLDDFVGHPTALLFLCGAADTHVPRASAETFALALRPSIQSHESSEDEQGYEWCRSSGLPSLTAATRVRVCVLPSRGWQGHVLDDPADATSRALAFFAAAAPAEQATAVGASVAAFTIPAPQAVASAAGVTDTDALTQAAAAPLTAPRAATKCNAAMCSAAICSATPRAAPCTLTSAAALHALLDGEPLEYVCVWATADWCVPCKRLLPAWSDLTEADSGAFAGKVAFAVADLTDEAEQGLDGGSSLSEALRISTLPTFVLFRVNQQGKGGNHEVGRAEGASHKRPARRLWNLLRSTV